MDNSQDKEQQAQNVDQQAADEKVNTGAETETAEPEKSDESVDTTEAEAAESESPKDEAQVKIDELTKKLADMNDKYLRMCAEYDNYRKRTIKEKADLLKSAGADVLTGLLTVVDDFERAEAHINDAQDVKSLKEGVDLIHKKFNEFLKKRGVVEIEAKGLPLDTSLHEAITMIPAPTPDMKGKIFDCVEKGYKLGDKVIRFAKVVVCQ